jgi:pilus assembly protein FimV
MHSLRKYLKLILSLRRQLHDVIFLPVYSAFEGGMLRQKPLVISLALAGLIATTDTSALGLGRLNVTTALGQPFVAEVDLSVAAGDDLDSIRANIASPTVYRSANVEYQGVLQTIRVQTLRRPSGQPYLRLTSNQAINEPYLDVLLEVNSNTGRLVREYVVLLDPAGTPQTQTADATNIPRATITAPAPTAAAPIAAPTPGPATPASRAPSPAARTPAPTPSAGASGGTYTVKSGDTLFSIASRNNPGVTIEQLMIAIQRANPNAFIGGNINRLRSGATLSLPNANEAGTVANNEAVSEVKAQTASWRGYVSRASENVPTVASDAPQARASGRVSGAVTDSAGSGPATDKLKLSQGDRSKTAAKEDKVAAGKALKEEQSRAAELAKTKENLEKALTLKSQTMADAQAKAKEAAKPAPAPAPVAVAAAPTPAPAPAPVVAPPPPPPAPVPVAPPPPPPPPAEPPPPPAPVVTAPPPPAPVAVPKPAPSPTPVAAPSFIDTLMENPIIPLGGLGVVLAGLGGLMWSRRRSAARSLAADSKLSEPVVNTVNPDTVFGTSGLGVVKTNDAPIASQFSRSGMGTIDAGEVDPVAEAEVYIAYGREAQAEEILREALARDPQRADVATKLAEMAATQGNRESFDKWIGAIEKMERGSEYKMRLGELAAAHFPGHSLATGFSGSIAKASDVVSEAASAAKGAGSSALGMGTAAAGTAAVAATAAASGAVKGFFAPAPAPMVEPPAFKPAASDKSSGLDFVLDGMTVAAPPPASMDKGVPTVIPTIKPGDTGKKKSLEDDLADLEASLKKATSTGQLPESSMDFTDFSTATPTNLGTVGPAMKPEMLDLSFDANRSGTMEPTPSILDGQWHDAATKLDLARAYEEMGDQEGAKEILREVMHDGDESQKAEARALLAKLGG